MPMMALYSEIRRNIFQQVLCFCKNLFNIAFLERKQSNSKN